MPSCEPSPACLQLHEHSVVHPHACRSGHLSMLHSQGVDRRPDQPGVGRQAMDRAHRIGQKKEVQVFRFCVENSIEEKVRRALSR